jgi:predicted CXXCH cytochrome family protein
VTNLLLTHSRRLVVGLAVLSACTSEKIVYRDREPFNQPVDAASGFVGYYTASTKQTACGNCHVGTQRDWKGTAHAKAYKTLADLPAGTAQGFCYDCHTVGPNGNRTTGNVGYKAVQDTAYHDVQCEACHGPGFNHVKEPDLAANWPYARAGTTPAKETCLSCHSGTHHPFAEEWGASGHAQIIATAANRPAADGCPACHNGKETLKAWGVTSTYVESTEAAAFPVNCSVCHDPHGSANSKQLRFPIDTPDPERNLCMKCHLRRFEPALNSSRLAPHAPQGAVLLGVAGYRPPGFIYAEDSVLTSHASDRNPRLCAGCHVQAFTVTDATSGNFVFQATGHLFAAVPCLDAQGKPIADNSCAYTATARSWKTCVSAGCHADAAIAAQRLNGARNEIELLAAQIWVDTDHDETVEASDGGYLATLKSTRPTEWKVDATITPAEGAEFNSKTVGERYANGDKSKGVHNPFLARALLSATINELQSVYGLPAPPAAVQGLVDRSIEQLKLRQPNIFAHGDQR